MSASNFRNTAKTNNILRKVKFEINNSKLESIQHYKANHNHVPCWISIDSLTFGLSKQLYSIMKPDDKKYISSKLINYCDLTESQQLEF